MEQYCSFLHPSGFKWPSIDGHGSEGQGGETGPSSGGEHFFELRGGTKFASQGGERGGGGNKTKKMGKNRKNWKIF